MDNGLFENIKQALSSSNNEGRTTNNQPSIIPAARVRYLSEIKESSVQYNRFVDEQSTLARQLFQLQGTIGLLRSRIGTQQLEIRQDAQTETVTVVRHEAGEPDYLKELVDLYGQIEEKLHPECRRMLREWPDKVKRYKAAKYQFQVRDKVIEQDLYTESLSGLKIPKVSLPRYENWGDILRWQLTENVPGEFPYAAGVFPLKRDNEDPTRMFAGEGGPERTNRRFHYVSQGCQPSDFPRPSTR
jgi:methylmalonyl-CoA mutase